MRLNTRASVAAFVLEVTRTRWLKFARPTASALSRSSRRGPGVLSDDETRRWQWRTGFQRGLTPTSDALVPRKSAAVSIGGMKQPH